MQDIVGNFFIGNYRVFYSIHIVCIENKIQDVIGTKYNILLAKILFEITEYFILYT